MKKIKFTTTRLFVAAFLLCFSMTIQTQAAPGDLDLSFGNGGKVVTPIGNGDEGASAVAIQSDGKIVAAGSSYNGANNGTHDDFELARYNTDGSLDISFGTGGKVVTPIGNRAYAQAVAIQADGKIIAAGSADIGGIIRFTLSRYNTDGSLDTTFGMGGIVLTPIGNRDSAGAVAIQSDGKIVAAGFAVFGDTSIFYTFALVRYNTNGLLDTTFGTGGIVTTQFVSSISETIDIASAVAIQSDGKIVAAGVSDLNDYGTSFALARYNTNGSLDTSFGSGGKVTTYAGGTTSGFSDVVIQSDGKIVAVGVEPFGSIFNSVSVLARYNTNGSLDTTFGTGGKVLTLVGESSSARAVEIQSDGKIVAAGYSRIESIGKFTLARYNTNGSLDTTFGTNGIVVTPIGNNAGASAVAIQPDGKIVVAGSTSTNGATQDFALVRYLSDSNTGRTQFDFDGDGKADLSVFRPSDRIWYLNRSTQGFAATQFGLSTDKITPADYDGDGKTDIAVYRAGIWYLQRSQLGFLGIALGAGEDIPQPADFDGDGKAEIAVWRPSNGMWSVYNLATGRATSFQLGTNTDKPIVGDYDGDGRADYAVWRPSNGNWIIQRSTAGLTQIQFGLSADKPVPADYDGDGKTDVAVFRPSEENWYTHHSLTNTVQVVNWGLATDALVPADYDGDGKVDVAVYRGGTWYIRQTTGAINYSYFGLGSDTPTQSAYLP